MSFHDEFAEILGEGMPYMIFPTEPNLTTIRCYGEDGNTARMIQYETDPDEFRILSLYIGDEPEGGGHILRIAAAAADLFKAEGYQVVKGKDFTSTPAGEAFKGRVESVGGTEEDGFSVLGVDDFQKLKLEEANKTEGDPGEIAEP